MARYQKCVRCGSMGRVFDTFLCHECFTSTERRIEQRVVELAADGDYRVMRQLLVVEHGWAGEWPKYSEVT